MMEIFHDVWLDGASVRKPRGVNCIHDWTNFYLEVEEIPPTKKKGNILILNPKALKTCIWGNADHFFPSPFEFKKRFFLVELFRIWTQSSNLIRMRNAWNI